MRIEKGTTVKLKNGKTKYEVWTTVVADDMNVEVPLVSKRSGQMYMTPMRKIVFKNNVPLEHYEKKPYDIVRVIYNEPATIVFFADGQKEVVKVKEGEPFHHMVGVQLCVMKRFLGEKEYNRSKKYLFDAVHEGILDNVAKSAKKFVNVEKEKR